MKRDAILACVIVPCVLAAVAAAAPAAAADAPLGRMFFTPAQRAQLDVARTQRARSTLSTERTEETAAPAPQSLTYDGLVRRSDGKSTVFLNSRPVHDKEPVGGAIVGRVRPDGGVSLQMPQTGRTIDLRPGQSVELLSGQIEEAYGRKPAVQAETKPAADGKSTTKPVSPERPREERKREDREQEERIQDAVTRALQERSTARPDAMEAPPTPQQPPR